MANYEGLVDHRGRPIEKKLLTAEVAGPTITGVRSPIAGYPADGLTPPKLTSILKEADVGQPLRYYEVAETIEERDMHYAGVLGVRKRSVSQLDITIEPGSSDPQHEKHAEVIREWLKRDELQGELFDTLDAVGKGESFTEIGWDTSEGQWVPKRLDWRDPRWFRPWREDLSTPMLIDNGGDDQFLPAGKFIHLVARGKSGIPARSGIARLATWFWVFKSMTVRDWAIYSATFGQPLRVGKYGPGATDEDKNTLFRAVANIAGDCAAIIPNSMLIEFVQAPNAGASATLYEDRADWLDQQLSKAILGQTTTTDAIGGGHAVSKEHRQVQEDIERADAKVLGATLTRDLATPWIQLEFGPQKAYPRIRIGRPEEKNVDQIVKTVRGFKLSIKKSEAYNLAGISVPEPTDEVITFDDAEVETAPVEDGDEVKPEGKAQRHRRQLRDRLPPFKGTRPPVDPTLHQEQSASGAIEVDQEQLAIDALTSSTEGYVGGAMDLMLDFVAGLVAESSSLEDFRSRLLAKAPDIPTAGLANALRQAQVVAKLTGRAALKDG